MPRAFAGDLEIEGRFIDNTAADGAGVHIGDIAKGGVVCLELVHFGIILVIFIVCVLVLF
jgi:hypothetical protein